MIIYTPLASEDIFPPDGTEWQNHKNIPVANGMVTVRKAANDRWEVFSLQSSNPQDYLLPEYQPGVEWTM